MSLLSRLNKPEYFFRPIQLLRRVVRSRAGLQSRRGRREMLHLPWGHEIQFRIDENVGFSLWHLGVYDLVVSEALWRLVHPGEDDAIDAGANLGYMTSLLAAR